jgi:hypothetical protein
MGSKRLTKRPRAGAERKSKMSETEWSQHENSIYAVSHREELQKIVDEFDLPSDFVEGKEEKIEFMEIEEYGAQYRAIWRIVEMQEEAQEEAAEKREDNANRQRLQDEWLAEGPPRPYEKNKANGHLWTEEDKGYFPGDDRNREEFLQQLQDIEDTRLED